LSSDAPAGAGSEEHRSYAEANIEIIAGTKGEVGVKPRGARDRLPVPSSVNRPAMASSFVVAAGFESELAEKGIERLRTSSAALPAWRELALDAYDRGHVKDCIRVLDEALKVRSAWCDSPERQATLHMLIAAHITYAPMLQSKAECEKLVKKTQGLLTEAEMNEGVSSGSGAHVMDNFVNRGFLALAERSFRQDSSDHELKRADMLFTAALKLDSSSPRALLGRAVTYMYWKEWQKALLILRQVLLRATRSTNKDAVRLKCLKQLRFLMAMCFCGLGRFEQTRNALLSVVDADAKDVESLCALAHLEALIAKDGVGESMHYLDMAVEANSHHPVVLCQLANHAFYCGLQDGHGEDRGKNGAPDSWELASDLLARAVTQARSAQVRAEAHYQIGRLKHAQGKYEEAYDEYSKCQVLQSAHFACLYGLAQTCMQLRKLDEAIALLESVRGNKGNLPQVVKLLTFAYMQSGEAKAKEAAACADTLVSLDKEDVEAWTMRAEAHDQLSMLSSSSSSPKVGLEAYETVAKLLEDRAASAQNASPQMWNNLGTLRSLQGEADGAKEAYKRGLELAEQKLQAADLAEEEAKDLHIAALTIRFNRAWLVESLDQPDFLQATEDYMRIREEHNWYADTLLQIGSQWRRVGDTERAVQAYEEAMKHNPVLGALMQAEVYREACSFSEALQAAEMAVKRAGPKQFHYAHVYLGNLYYEAAHNTRSRKELDRNMCKALWNFTRALEHDKDSHYAANGIGLVFAQRGKLDFAKRTFQSVMQHQGLAGDPCVYINLAHTYLRTGGDNVRKAIALYERAKKLKPHDLTIRLYLAKAHFGLQEFDRCCGILSDATQIWPDDLLLRYNWAISLESFGVFLVQMEKKTKRVVGVNSGMDQMVRAVELLNAAAKVYHYIDSRWTRMSDAEKRRIGAMSGSPANLAEEMHRVGLHKDYCADIHDKAMEELDELLKTRADMEVRINKISLDKKAKQQAEEEELVEEQRQDEEKRLEMEERALTLMESTKEIELGKDLASVADQLGRERAKQAPKPLKTKGMPVPREEGARRSRGGEKKEKKKKRDKKKKKKDKKEKKGDDGESGSGSGEGSGDGKGDGGGELGGEHDEGADGPRPVELPVEMEDTPAGTAAAAEAEDSDGSARSRKKKKKDKREKKEKKKKKKTKKRKRSDASSAGEEEQPSDGEKRSRKEGDDLDEIFGPEE